MKLGPVLLTRNSMRAVDETRTRDIHLGKVVLYQLSYNRATKKYYTQLFKTLQIEKDDSKGISLRYATH